MKILDIFKKNRPEPLNWRDWTVLGGSSLLFSVISLFNMSRWSVWFDEAFGMYLIRSDYMEVAKLTSTDVHPPMYYWLLKFWTSIFGTSEIAIRSLSLVCLLAAFVIVYMLIRRVFGQKAAMYAAGLFAISPLLFRYSNEARMYGLTTAIVAGSTYLMVEAMEKPKRWKWLAYGVLVSVGMWTHYFTAVAFAAQWVWRFMVVRQKNIKNTLANFFSKDWILAHIVAIGLFLPWLPFAVKQLSGVQGGGFWISAITPASPFDFLAETLMFRTNSEATGWFALGLWVIVVMLAIITARVYKVLLKKQRMYYNLLLVMAFVPLVLLMIASLPPLRPALVNRYILPSSLFVVAYIGVTIGIALSAKIKSTKRLGAGLLVMVAAAMISGVVHVYSIGNINKDTGDKMFIWPTMQLVWEATKLNEPTLVASPTRYYEIAYYEDRAPVGTGVFFEQADSLEWGSYDPLRGQLAAKVYDTVEFARKNGGVIWYVADWMNENNPKLPSSGEWRVLQEIHAPGVVDGVSSIRAVEIELVE